MMQIFRESNVSVQDFADRVDCAGDGHLWPLPDQWGGLHPSFGGVK